MGKWNGLFILAILLLPLCRAQETAEQAAATANIIREESQKTREFIISELDKRDAGIQASYEQEKNALLQEFNNMLWMNRILSFVILAGAMVFGYAISLLLNVKNKRDLEALRLKYDQPPEPKTATGGQ